MSTKSLETYLKPLQLFLNTQGVTEICINRPQEVWIEKDNTFSRVDVEELTLNHLEALSELVAEFNDQEISREKPILSASLLNGERAEFVRAPACEKNKLICSIRRQNMRDLSLDDYNRLGAFDDVKTQTALSSIDQQLLQLKKQKKYKEFIQLAIIARKNILISGGTSTGKTTFLNACLKTIPTTERLITIEDTHEVNITQPNSVSLLAPRKGQGVAEITVEHLFESCLRLRPDRFFLSEIRGNEVFAFLEAINSGHPGSLSTIHADSTEGAFEQLYRKMRRYGDKSPRKDAFDYLKSIIHIVVQLKKCSSNARYMYVADIYFDKEYL